MCHHPSVSLNKEKICREISEDKIAICKKTQGLRSGNFSDLNSACSKVLVPVKIFQFHDMHYESERYRDAANGQAVFIEIFQHNQQYDTLLPVTPCAHKLKAGIANSTREHDAVPRQSSMYLPR